MLEKISDISQISDGDNVVVVVGIFTAQGFVKEAVPFDPLYLLGGVTPEFLKANTAFNNFEDDIKSIEHALLEAGVQYSRLEVPFPRDSFVDINDLYFTLAFFENTLDGIIKQFSALGEGGRVVPANNFLIVSSYNIPKENQPIMNSMAKEVFQGILPSDMTIYFVNPCTGYNAFYKTHIDLTVGCIPEAKIITLDKIHYDQQRDEFDMISESTDFDVVPIDCKEEGVLAGNNYLVIPELEKTVISNKGATSVNAELKNLGVNVIETPKPLCVLPGLGASVRCVTNRVANPVLTNYIMFHIAYQSKKL